MVEKLGLAVSCFCCEDYGLIEVTCDVPRRVGIRADDQSDAGVAGKGEEVGGRILLRAWFVPARGVQFDRTPGLCDCLNGRLIEATEITFGAV